ncbi:MAG: urease accessory protein UreD [Candidatus Thiodiazotropha sp.]
MSYARSVVSDPQQQNTQNSELKTQPGWQASLNLGFRKTPARTVLAERRHRGPLSVQRAFYPEGDLCHVYLLHPPGGVAGGDELKVLTRVEPGAQALVTTPGATKFYRSAGPLASLTQELQLRDATLEWLPQENILFPGARAEIHTRVMLEGRAGFIGWEINCLGRAVLKERFDPGQARFRFSLYREGRPLLLERLELGGAETLDGPAGLRGQPVIGTLVATLEDAQALETLREDPDDEFYTRELALTWVDGLLVARYLGDSTEHARNCFVALWQRLRPMVIGRSPCAPRIWNT